MGTFITVEGPEGCGKTTICSLLEEHLKKLGYNVVLTREPGGVPIAEDIRDIILDKKNINLDYRCEAILYAGARRQHLVEKVIPFLNRGYIVLCDRFIDSSLAYQGYARGIGIDKVYDLNLFAIENMLPDITLYFDIDPALGLERVNSSKGREINRLDVEALSFHKKVRKGFLMLTEMFPDRIRTVDASQSIEQVFNAALKIIIEHLNKVYGHK